MTRYAVDIIRPDGGRWRTVHLIAASRDDAIARATGWLRRNLRYSRGYTAQDARPESAR